jgi:hypothetical protein
MRIPRRRGRSLFGIVDFDQGVPVRIDETPAAPDLSRAAAARQETGGSEHAPAVPVRPASRLFRARGSSLEEDPDLGGADRRAEEARDTVALAVPDLGAPLRRVDRQEAPAVAGDDEARPADRREELQAQSIRRGERDGEAEPVLLPLRLAPPVVERPRPLDGRRPTAGRGGMRPPGAAGQERQKDDERQRGGEEKKGPECCD